MERFSDDLRREREQRGISLDAVSEITKVSQRHLLALERGDFGSLPGGVFRKGILRSYLTSLGLDPAPWMPRFETCLAELATPAETPVDLAAFAENVRRTRGERARSEPTRWPGVFAMLLLLIAFGWCVWRFALRGHVVLSRSLAPVRTEVAPRLPRA